MSLTRYQAIDEMAAIFKTAWEVTASQNGDRIKWENVGTKSIPPDLNLPWARFVLRHATAFQATLSNAVGARRFRRLGILTVQLFQPIGKGLSGDVDLAKIVLDAYEGQTTTGGIIFREVVIQEVGPDGDFYQVNIVVSFEYDEVK